MSKSRTCFASSVCCSDEFCELPESARLLYYQLGFEQSTIGEINGASRIARGYGFNDADLQSLIDAGFIVETCGRRFIRHTFVNNLLSNETMKQAALNALGCVAGLEFEGHAFKSAYRLVDADSPNVSLMLDPNIIESKVKQGNGNATETRIQEKKKEKEKDNCNLENAQNAPDSTPCPQCMKPCAVSATVDGRELHGWCKDHGEFFFDAVGNGYI